MFNLAYFLGQPNILLVDLPIRALFFGGKANEISISNFSQKTSPFEEIVFQRLKKLRIFL